VKFPKIPAGSDKFRTSGRFSVTRARRCACGGTGALALCLGCVQACSSDATSTGSGAPAGGAAQTGASPSAGAVGVSGAASGGASSSVGGGGATSGGSAGSSGAAGSSSGSGGASSAGSAGASGSAGSAGAPASCVTSGTELCDDFETGMLDAQRWTQSKSNMTSIAVETGRAHSGQYAVHLQFVAGSQNTVTIAEGVTFPATPNKFYSRMWAYFAPDIPKAATGDFHTGFMMGGGNNDKGTTTLGMGMIGSDQQYLGYSIFFGDPKYEFGPWSNTRIVPNQWLCIELMEDGSDPTTEVRKVWLNDAELTDIESDSAKAGGTANPNHLPPKFDKVTFGVTEYHPIPTLTDMWIDDVRVSSQKIGCTK
jgi:hypothetical protein